MSNTTMWFDGPVAEAVSLVNTKNCVFIVYIFGNSQKVINILISNRISR